MPANDYILRELRVGDRHEAALLADMWNRSSAGWPGGWGGGVPITADRILSEDMAWHCYGRWVVEFGGEIVGAISLLADPADMSRAYIGTLNARPDHHGKGVGKRLVRRAIDCAIEGGFREVEIHTWPGNLKAMPLYKKMGFFWIPETSVHMQNFVPTIIRTPLLAGFFHEADWYDLQVRDLSAKEDIDYWHGVRVFRYAFERDGRRAEVVADRNARMLTAVETDELYVAAWVEDEYLPALMEHRIHCELRNKTDRPMAVGVLAHGESGVPVSVEEDFTLTGRKRFDVPFRLPADLERKEPGEPPHRVLTTVTVDDVPIELGTAVQMRDPVEVSYDGWGFAAGKESKLHVNLRNRLPFPVSGTLLLSSPEGLGGANQDLPFRVSRGGWSSVPVKVRPSGAGAYAVRARVGFSQEVADRLAEGETPAGKPFGREHELWVRAFEPGGFVVSDDDWERRVTVESDRQVLQFHRVGGWLNVTDKSNGRRVINLNVGEAGPPFGEFSPTPTIYDVDARSTGGAVWLTVHRTYGRWAGLSCERTVVLTDGMVELRHRLLNASDAPRQVQFRTGAWGGIGPALVSVPLREGLVQHRQHAWGEWPRWGELRLRSQDFAETWFAAEEDGNVFGMVWSGDAEVEPGGGSGSIQFGPVAVPAGGSTDLPAVRIVAGPGDFRRVRWAWDQYVNEGALLSREQRNLLARDVVRASLGSVPLLMVRPKQRATVELVNDGKRPESGSVHVSLPKAVALPDGKRGLEFKAAGICAGKPLLKPITLECKANGPTAGAGELRLTTPRTELKFPLPVIVVRGRGGRLRVKEDGDTVSVDSGVLRYTASAAHGGGIVSLKARGRELLRSSYPEPRAYLWMNPWFGGVRGLAGSEWDRRFHAVEWKVQAVSVDGAWGLRWKGVEVVGRPTHPDLKWLRVTTQYLTTAGSNLLAVLVTAANRTKAVMGANPNVTVWPAGERLPAWVDREGELVAYRPEEHQYGMQAGTWACMEVGRSAVLAAAVPKRDPGWRVSANMQTDGFRSMGASNYCHLDPGIGQMTHMFWLAACRSVEEAHAYRCLSELDVLP